MGRKVPVAERPECLLIRARVRRYGTPPDPGFFGGETESKLSLQTEPRPKRQAAVGNLTD
jgi:hypothetical protein